MLLWGLTAANVAVYLAWNTLGKSEAGDLLLRTHFLVSAQGLVEGRFWTLLSSEFSHYSPSHLLFNMFALHAFFPAITARIGAARALTLYVVGGVVASLGHVAYNALSGDPTPALGASGAVMAFAALFGVLHPRQVLLILGFIPLPAALAVALFIGIDLYGLFFGESVVANAAHLGGVSVGLLASVLLKKRR